MFSKISARIVFKVLNAPTINSKAVCLRSFSSSNNIDDPLMRVDRLQRKQRFYSPSSVFNPAEANQLNILIERKEFMALFPDVLQDISELIEQSCKDKDVVDRIIRAVNYNVPNGKPILALSLITTYVNLVDTAQLTPENMKMIRLLAWILEMIAVTVMVADDIADGGTIRRDQPCWYLAEDVKLTAVNDASAGLKMLKMMTFFCNCNRNCSDDYLTHVIGSNTFALVEDDIRFSLMDHQYCWKNSMTLSKQLSN